MPGKNLGQVQQITQGLALSLHPEGCLAFPRWSQGAGRLGVVLTSEPGALTVTPLTPRSGLGQRGPAHLLGVPASSLNPLEASYWAPLPWKSKGHVDTSPCPSRIWCNSESLC